MCVLNELDLFSLLTTSHQIACSQSINDDMIMTLL